MCFCVCVQLVEIDRFAPETWCVVSNCFSLQRDPEMAVKFFERALQVNPRFTYAHTLCGHEHVSNEDLDKGTECFRRAIAIDSRHYNAWYGLGAVYYRQERLDLAEYHFRKALSICPVSSVLHCFLSMVLHAHGDAEHDEQAENVLRSACFIDPKNSQVIHFGHDDDLDDDVLMYVWTIEWMMMLMMNKTMMIVHMADVFVLCLCSCTISWCAF